MGVPSDPNLPVTGVMNRNPMRSIDYLVVHCSATRPDMNIGRKEIDVWHRQRGFDCIGYHYVIRRNGDIEKGRADTDPGAHDPSVNRRSIAICLIGGVDSSPQMVPTNNFTPEQLDALRALLIQLKSIHTQAMVIGHRDSPGKPAKACPSFAVIDWWKEMNA